MRSKAPLAMMEQIVMLLVFALAAALCLQAFVKSDQLSKRSEARDHAAVQCQSAAEAVRHCGGDMAAAAVLLEVPYPYTGAGSPLEIHYNADWTLCDTREYAYCLLAESLDSGIDGLGSARVSVTETGAGETLFELDIAWQEEVGAHG